MPKVVVLPEHVASQIAAGEVVERPASVVKELVENALDATATKIEIAIGSDCRDIRIADNGCGMAPEDAVLAFHRHATSKLKQVEDLWALKSLGFRGEALPSIASVAKVTCYTRTLDANSGHRIQCADGQCTAVESGCAPGTVMEITDLFYNVPARLNFLKKPATEFAHIDEIVKTLALAYPGVAFHLSHGGRTALRSSGSGSLPQVMAEVDMHTSNVELATLDYTDDRFNIRVYGHLVKPPHFRGDRKGILSIVNRRPVRCALTYKALDYAYSDLIPRGRHPVAIVCIEIDPAMVDVNIHPTKKEIKYSQGNDIYLCIQRSLMQALRSERQMHAVSAQESFEFTPPTGAEDLTFSQARSFSPGIAVSNSPAARVSHQHYAGSASIGETETASLETASAFPRADTHPGPANLIQYARLHDANATALTAQSALIVKEAGFELEPSFYNRTEQLSLKEEFSRLNEALRQSNKDTAAKNVRSPQLPSGWRLAGYIHNTYIVLETPEGLAIVEQHIAHERTLYERILQGQAVPGRITDNSQRLVISVPLHLTPQQRIVVQEHGNELELLGFEFAEAEDETISCVQVPLELANQDYATIIHTMLEDLSTADNTNLDLEATKSIACQSAIKNGMPLSESDIIKLVADWFASPRRETCPHGRPVMLAFPMERLFQLFHPA